MNRPLLPPQRDLPELETERLRLRPIRQADAGDVFDYTADPAVLQYTTGVPPGSLADTEAWLRAVLADPETHMWAICLRSSPAVVGVIEFGVPAAAVGSVHYALARPLWGRGLMPEAVQAVCAWAFDSLPSVVEIRTAVLEANAASARVLEKCGFERVGVVEDVWTKEQHPVQLLEYRLKRETATAWRRS